MDLHALSAIEILALTIYGEARGELIDGQIAVGCVIRNRLHNSNHQSYHEIVLAPNQFSCWLQKDVNFPVLNEIAEKMVAGQVFNDIFLKQCMWVAHGIVNWDIIDTIFHAEYYLENSLFSNITRPKWARKAFEIRVLGNHTFFRL